MLVMEDLGKPLDASELCLYLHQSCVFKILHSCLECLVVGILLMYITYQSLISVLPHHHHTTTKWNTQTIPVATCTQLTGLTSFEFILPEKLTHIWGRSHFKYVIIDCADRCKYILQNCFGGIQILPVLIKTSCKYVQVFCHNQLYFLYRCLHASFPLLFFLFFFVSI